MIKVVDVSYAYEKKTVIHHINTEINRNIMTGIIGPNGCGKTTFMKLITGILVPSKGYVLLDNKDIKTYSKKQIAQKISVLSQHVVDGFQFTVYEIVSLGRYAHQQGLFSTWTDEDERIVQLTMEQTGVTSLKDRTLDSLSGGEKQRVFLAQCLAQQPDIIILDEPTNHLDIKYQIEICELLRELVDSGEMTVICIFHDLNLASLFCDEIILMKDGKLIEKNQTNKILTNKFIKDVYHSALEIGIHPKRPNNHIYIHSNKSIDQEWEIAIHPPENLLMSNIDLKCMSSIEGITWRKNFIYDIGLKEMKVNPPNIKIFLSESKLRKILTIFVDGIVEDVDYIQLIIFVSKNYQFDEVIIGATFRKVTQLNLIEIKNILNEFLGMNSLKY